MLPFNSPPAAKPSPRRRTLRALLALFLLGIAGGACAAALIAWLLSGGRAVLDGDLTAEGLIGEVRIERDACGVPTLTAENRFDLAFAAGFVHGQDRFFQMDFLRRRAAGELAELFGPVLIDEDRRMRLHRFRARAEKGLVGQSVEARRLLCS